MNSHDHLEQTSLIDFAHPMFGQMEGTITVRLDDGRITARRFRLWHWGNDGAPGTIVSDGPHRCLRRLQRNGRRDTTQSARWSFVPPDQRRATRPGGRLQQSGAVRSRLGEPRRSPSSRSDLRAGVDAPKPPHGRSPCTRRRWSGVSLLAMGSWDRRARLGTPPRCRPRGLFPEPSSEPCGRNTSTRQLAHFAANSRIQPRLLANVSYGRTRTARHGNEIDNH